MILENENVVTKPYIMAGKEFDVNDLDSIWLSDRFADAWNLSVGDTFAFSYHGVTVTKNIAGLIESPEYEYMCADKDIETDYKNIAYVYMPYRAFPTKEYITHEYYSEVLPEDKAQFVEKEKAAGRKVIMIGDGVNDSPALSAADVGIAISEGAELAREIADIMIGEDNLTSILTLRQISAALMKRIGGNYRFIIVFNTILILLGVGGILQPTTSAFLHNASTLTIGLKSMQNLLVEEKK